MAEFEEKYYVKSRLNRDWSSDLLMLFIAIAVSVFALMVLSGTQGELDIKFLASDWVATNKRLTLLSILPLLLLLYLINVHDRRSARVWKQLSRSYNVTDVEKHLERLAKTFFESTVEIRGSIKSVDMHRDDLDEFLGMTRKRQELKTELCKEAFWAAHGFYAALGYELKESIKDYR